MTLAGAPLRPSRPIRTGPADAALRRARRCYDHLAGEIAVGIADHLVGSGRLALDDDGAALTEDGAAYLRARGIDVTESPRRNGFCRPCLDWSERRPHIAGAVGRAILDGLIRQHWLRPAAGGRALAVTPKGAAELERAFGIRPVP